MEVDKEIFETVVTESVAEAVTEQIERLIVTGVLKSGQKLPSERELSDLMTVSRPKVRDAIKVLEARGLLTVSHGEGTFIASLTGTALSPAMVDLFSRHTDAFNDYLEFRRELEGFAAHLAAQRATESDRKIIARVISRMEAAHGDDDPTEEATLDASLHASIADAAHNAMMTHMMASVYEIMRRGVFYNRSFLYSRPSARTSLLQQHKDIANAVLDGDPGRASQAAEAHLDFVKSAFQASSAESNRGKIARKRLVLFDGAGAGFQPKSRRRPTGE